MRAGWLAAALAVPCAALAGALSGPVLDAGVRGELVDVIRLPASGTNPRTRINELREAPDGTGRLFVVDLRGRLYALDGAALHTYLDLAALRPALRTQPGLASGFVSFAFHPEWAVNGIFYTVHTETPGGGVPTHGPAEPISIAQHSILSEWTAADPAANAWSGTSRELLRVASPHHFHNLGQLAFDPRAGPGDAEYGLLYVGAGDFGSVVRGAPEQLQRADTLYGAVLRIDPTGGSGQPYSYGIPASNPFASDGDPDTFGEIYSIGARNAHRLVWSEAFGGPFACDVGEDHLEEINRLVPGANTGWPLREGNRALDESDPGWPGTVFPLPPGDASLGFTYPLAQYDHDEGLAIAGGFVLESDPSSLLYEHFVFGDIVSGRLFHTAGADLLAADDGNPATTAQLYELTPTVGGTATTLLAVVRAATGQPSLQRVDLRLALDLSGNLYLTTKQDGWVRRLVPETADPVPALHGAVAAALAALLAGLGARAAARRPSRGSPACPSARSGAPPRRPCRPGTS